MSTNAKAPTSAPVNVLLMLREHCAPRHRELHDELRKLAKREQDVRAEISRIERHAAIEGITLASEPLTEVAPPATPTPEPTP